MKTLPTMKIRLPSTHFVSKSDAEDFAKEIGADLDSWGYDARLKESSLDLRFENHYDGSRILENMDGAEGYLEFEDGTISRHYIRRDRTYDD